MKFEHILEVLLANEEYLSLFRRKHHITNRLQHCVDVGFVAYNKCTKLNMDPQRTTVAALCHDFYITDWRDAEYRLIQQPWKHAQRAADNARRNFHIDDEQYDAILTHMWPCGKHVPKTRMAWIINRADTFCTLRELWLRTTKRETHLYRKLETIL
jgi:uncharacterized protein